jgi:putative integral membrane protein (TIGR02587 family)
MTESTRDAPPPPSTPAWKNEINDLIRGASGGFLFGIPLIYTMEVWWIGSLTRPPIMISILAITYFIVFLLNRTDGFRQKSPDGSIEALMDSVEAIAIGCVCTTIVLILLREVTLDTSLQETLGKIIFESIPFSIGVALARSILKGMDDENENSSNDEKNSTLADIGATCVGAVFIAMAIAPTDEIPMLAAATSPPWLIGLVFASLLISYGIVFVAGFTTQFSRMEHRGLFQNPIEETAIAYFLSLLVSAALLWFFHRLDFSDPWTSWLNQTLLLGLPATVGGAAGRIAI